MITVGLVKELVYLSTVINSPVKTDIKIQNHVLSLEINRESFSAYYNSIHIWSELVDIGINNVVSHFGLESCHTITKIIDKINAGDGDWQKLTYFYSEEKPLT